MPLEFLSSLDGSLWLVFPLIGIFAGLLAGLLGLGGGVVLVPGLYFFLVKAGYASGYEIQFAIGTSLACIVPNSFSSALVHHKTKNIDWALYKVLIPGFIIGAIIGGLFADWIDPNLLKSIFGIVCLLIALRIFFGFKPPVQSVIPKRALDTFNGTVMGGIAALTGIGGGALVNPYMLWRGYSIRKAIGTASAAVVAISLFGSLTYLVTSPNKELSIPHIGYVIWPAVLLISVFSIIFARIGAYFTDVVPVARLRQLLAVILCVVAIKFIV